MILPQTAEYAIRAMAQLALLPRGQAVRATDLSKMTHIPEHYLSKVMRKLVAKGLLESEKGHGGGFKLVKPRKSIRFIDILSAVELELEPNRCAFGWGECSGKNPCILHPAFTQLKDAYAKWATKTTLADLSEVPKQP